MHEFSNNIPDVQEKQNEAFTVSQVKQRGVHIAKQL